MPTAQGTEDEWIRLTADTEQNTICPTVMRGPDGEAYDTEGILFRRPDGRILVRGDSRTAVTFPYTPDPEYRDIGWEAGRNLEAQPD